VHHHVPRLWSLRQKRWSCCLSAEHEKRACAVCADDASWLCFAPCCARHSCCPHSVTSQDTVNEVNGLAHRVKNEIQALDDMNAHSLQQRGHGVGSASERTRTSITAGRTWCQLAVAA
jgi:hypothetical protein